MRIKVKEEDLVVGETYKDSFGENLFVLSDGIYRISKGKLEKCYPYDIFEVLKEDFLGNLKVGKSFVTKQEKSFKIIAKSVKYEGKLIQNLCLDEENKKVSEFSDEKRVFSKKPGK